MRYDIIVIGAGPAGTFAAIQAGKDGLNTLIIEEDSVVGMPVHCGECLSDIAVKRMNLELPERVISKHINGVKIIFPRKITRQLDEKGYVLDKQFFEQWLASLAEENGASIKIGCKVESAKRSMETGNWIVKTTRGEFEAKILIDASGVKSFSSKILNIVKPFKTVLGVQYELLGVPNDDFLHFFLQQEFAPHGYVWIIPKSRDRANVGLVTNKMRGAKDLLDAFLKANDLSNKIRIKTFGGLIPASGPVEKTFSDGLMIIGDAAGFTSPMFEGGTALGMMSGKFAAIVAKEAFEKDNYSASVLSKYEEMWKKEFPPYESLLKGKDSFYNFTDSELSLIGSKMPENISKLSFKEKLLYGLNVFMSNPSLLRKGLLPALKTFGYSMAKNYGW